MKSRRGLIVFATILLLVLSSISSQTSQGVQNPTNVSAKTDQSVSINIQANVPATGLTAQANSSSVQTQTSISNQVQKVNFEAVLTDQEKEDLGGVESATLKNIKDTDFDQFRPMIKSFPVCFQDCLAQAWVKNPNKDNYFDKDTFETNMKTNKCKDKYVTKMGTVQTSKRVAKNEQFSCIKAAEREAKVSDVDSNSITQELETLGKQKGETNMAYSKFLKTLSEYTLGNLKFLFHSKTKIADLIKSGDIQVNSQDKSLSINILSKQQSTDIAEAAVEYYKACSQDITNTKNSINVVIKQLGNIYQTNGCNGKGAASSMNSNMQITSPAEAGAASTIKNSMQIASPAGTAPTMNSNSNIQVDSKASAGTNSSSSSSSTPTSTSNTNNAASNTTPSTSNTNNAASITTPLASANNQGKATASTDSTASPATTNSTGGKLRNIQTSTDPNKPPSPTSNTSPTTTTAPAPTTSPTAPAPPTAPTTSPTIAPTAPTTSPTTAPTTQLDTTRILPILKEFISQIESDTRITDAMLKKYLTMGLEAKPHPQIIPQIFVKFYPADLLAKYIGSVQRGDINTEAVYILSKGVLTCGLGNCQKFDFTYKSDGTNDFYSFISFGIIKQSYYFYAYYREKSDSGPYMLFINKNVGQFDYLGLNAINQMSTTSPQPISTNPTTSNVNPPPPNSTTSTTTQVRPPDQNTGIVGTVEGKPVSVDGKTTTVTLDGKIASVDGKIVTVDGKTPLDGKVTTGVAIDINTIKPTISTAAAGSINSLGGISINASANATPQALNSPLSNNQGIKLASGDSNKMMMLDAKTIAANVQGIVGLANNETVNCIQTQTKLFLAGTSTNKLETTCVEDLKSKTIVNGYFQSVDAAKLILSSITPNNLPDTFNTVLKNTNPTVVCISKDGFVCEGDTKVCTTVNNIKLTYTDDGKKFLDGVEYKLCLGSNSSFIFAYFAKDMKKMVFYNNAKCNFNIFAMFTTTTASIPTEVKNAATGVIDVLSKSTLSVPKFIYSNKDLLASCDIQPGVISNFFTKYYSLDSQSQGIKYVQFNFKDFTADFSAGIWSEGKTKSQFGVEGNTQVPPTLTLKDGIKETDFPKKYFIGVMKVGGKLIILGFVTLDSGCSLFIQNKTDGVDVVQQAQETKSMCDKAILQLANVDEQTRAKCGINAGLTGQCAADLQKTCQGTGLMDTLQVNFNLPDYFSTNFDQNKVLEFVFKNNIVGGSINQESLIKPETAFNTAEAADSPLRFLATTTVSFVVNDDVVKAAPTLSSDITTVSNDSISIAGSTPTTAATVKVEQQAQASSVKVTFGSSEGSYIIRAIFSLVLFFILI